MNLETALGKGKNYLRKSLPALGLSALLAFTSCTSVTGPVPPTSESSSEIKKENSPPEISKWVVTPVSKNSQIVLDENTAGGKFILGEVPLEVDISLACTDPDGDNDLDYVGITEEPFGTSTSEETTIASTYTDNHIETKRIYNEVGEWTILGACQDKHYNSDLNIRLIKVVEPSPTTTPTPQPSPPQENPNVYVLSSTETSQISSVTDNKIIFSNKVSYSTGDIIASGISDATPNGLLRKVTGISSDKKIVSTQQATLEEAVKNATIEYHGKLSPTGVSSISKDEIYRSIQPLTLHAFDFNIPIEDLVVLDVDGKTSTTYDQLILNGNVSFNSDFDIKIGIEDYSLKRFVFQNTTDEISEIKLTALASLEEIDKKINLWEYWFDPVTIFTPTTPPIPIVIFPKLEVNANFSGSISPIETSATQDATITAGINYENGQWNSIKTFSNDFGSSPPNLPKVSDFKFSFEQKLIGYLYGLAGPSAGIDEYLKIKPNETTKNWEFYGGLEVNLGVDMGVLSRIIPDYSATVINYEKLLNEGEMPVTSPTPQPSPEPSPEPSPKSSPSPLPSPSLPETSTLTDLRDGKIYRTVKIGNQWWMAENLNYKTDGSLYYDNDPRNGDLYGGLYNWETAKDVCYSGWHLPDYNDWYDLEIYLGEIGGGKLKSTGIDFWKSPNTGATNETGFTALPAGYREVNGSFSYLGERAYFWKSHEANLSNGKWIVIKYNSSEIYGFYETDREGNSSASIRCIKDP